MDYSQILQTLHVGSHPENLSDIEKLKNRCGVTAVLNLQTDQDLKKRGLDWSVLEASYRSVGIKPQRIPMRDFDYEDQKRILPEALKALTELLASGHTVYLHCNEGAGRSPLVAMAYLYWCCNLGLEEAIRHVKDRRACSPITELLEVARHDRLRNENFASE